jgi:hypothetical protein
MRGWGGGAVEVAAACLPVWSVGACVSLFEARQPVDWQLLTAVLCCVVLCCAVSCCAGERPAAVQPPGLTVTLHPYQLQSLAFMQVRKLAVPLMLVLLMALTHCVSAGHTCVACAQGIGAILLCLSVYACGRGVGAYCVRGNESLQSA